jgi:hypothetical protein
VLLLSLLFATNLALASPPRAPLPGRSPAAGPREALRELGVVALDKTDRHSPAVLANLVLLLRHGLPPGFLPALKNVRYLFAYAGHDAYYDLGAFHERARAISIGGTLAYPGEGKAPDMAILATLAHEIGHAFLLAKVSPTELREVSEKFGGWGAVFGAGAPPGNLHDAAFFAPRPGEPPKSERGRFSVCSQLSLKNVHEWFADAFAADALARLGRGGWLGAGWRSGLAHAPTRPGEFWTDYGQLSPAFARWLEEKIGAVVPPRYAALPPPAEDAPPRPGSPR